MSALMDDLDLGTVNPEAVEQSMAFGGLPPEGLHHAALNGCRPITEAKSPGRELTFAILAGPGAGLTVKDAVWITSDPKSKNRRVLIMHRLGLLKKVTAADGKHAYTPVEGKTDFMDCLGAECVIDVKHREREYEKNNQKRKITEAELTFEGVLMLDDKRCKDVPRGKPGAAQAAVATAAAAGAKAKDDYSDL
jgi:hypothetical protein